MLICGSVVYFHCCLNIPKFICAVCWWIVSKVLKDAAVNMEMHASQCIGTRISLGCPGLELLDQKLSVPIMQTVWEMDVPIYIATTSI